MTTKSDACTREDAEVYFEWLDDLRASGHVNMFGARPLLAEEFGLDRELSLAIMGAWGRTFDGKTPTKERAALAFN